MTKKRRQKHARPSEPNTVADNSQASGELIRVRACELVVLALMLLAGIVLRVAFPYLTTIEHFDEGIYASNLLFDERFDFQYPMRHLYAPPLVPALIEGSMLISGRVSGLAAIAPSWFAGCISLVVVWWLTRNWFGPAAAIGAAGLAAFSDVHAMFSRAALTDVWLLFFFLVAIAAFTRAFRTQRMLDFMVAGCAIGLAWWTKYNGWLPLLIALTAILGHWAIERSRTYRTGRLLFGWLVAAITAAAVFSPYLYALQSYGGYAQVAANHRRYIVGPAGWLTSLSQQLANLTFTDSTWGSLGWGIAIFGAWIVRRDALHRSPVARKEGTFVLGMSVAAVLLAQWIGGGIFLLLVGMLAVVITLGKKLLALSSAWRQRAPATQVSNESDAAVRGEWFVISWFVLLLTMTPLYTPYLRLMLPWISAAWMATACGLDSLFGWFETSEAAVEPKQSAKSTVSFGIVGGFFLLLGFVSATKISGRPTWLDDRRGLQRIAGEIDSAIGPGNGETVADGSRLNEASQSAVATDLRVVYVYGEPALLFQLRVVGQPLVLPVDTVELQPVVQGGKEVPTFLVVGIHATNDPGFQMDFEKARARFELIATYSYQPSTTVLLDQYDPRRMTAADKQADVKLYRVKGP